MVLDSKCVMVLGLTITRSSRQRGQKGPEQATERAAGQLCARGSTSQHQEQEPQP